MARPGGMAQAQMNRTKWGHLADHPNGTLATDDPWDDPPIFWRSSQYVNGVYGLKAIREPIAVCIICKCIFIYM